MPPELRQRIIAAKPVKTFPKRRSMFDTEEEINNQLRAGEDSRAEFKLRLTLWAAGA